jgi:hypothetical protein
MMLEVVEAAGRSTSMVVVRLGFMVAVRLKDMVVVRLDGIRLSTPMPVPI